MQQTRSFTISAFVFLIVACQVDSQEHFFEKMALEDEQNLISFTRVNLDIDLFDEDFNILYLVLRDCSCVIENIEFVKEQINKKSDLEKPLVLLIKPDKYDPTYLNEILDMQKEFPQSLSLFVDHDDHFIRHGNVYMVDHLFAYRDGRFNKFMKVESDSYKNVAEVLQ